MNNLDAGSQFITTSYKTKCINFGNMCVDGQIRIEGNRVPLAHNTEQESPFPPGFMLTTYIKPC